MLELTLITEMVLVAAFVCGLYEIRGRFGLAPLYIFLASTQYMQAVLGGAIFIRIAGGSRSRRDRWSSSPATSSRCC